MSKPRHKKANRPKERRIAVDPRFTAAIEQLSRMTEEELDTAKGARLMLEAMTYGPPGFANSAAQLVSDNGHMPEACGYTAEGVEVYSAAEVAAKFGISEAAALNFLLHSESECGRAWLYRPETDYRKQ